MYCFAIISNSNELSLENLKHPVDGKKSPYSASFFSNQEQQRIAICLQTLSSQQASWDCWIKLKPWISTFLPCCHRSTKIISTNQRTALNSQSQRCLLIDGKRGRRLDFSLYNYTTVQRKGNRCSQLKPCKQNRRGGKKRDSCLQFMSNLTEVDKGTEMLYYRTIVRMSNKKKTDVLGLNALKIYLQFMSNLTEVETGTEMLLLEA